MSSRRSIGVVLFQLGGPDSLDAIEPFLFNLFCDPDIIDFPFARLARRPLARLVARHRARKVAEHYAEIGGRSPIIDLTRAQATALERELRKSLEARVWVAMRYWHPLTEEVIREVERARPDELVLLPLYPQYSRVTTGSSLNEWHRQYARAAAPPVPVKIIQEFYHHALYLEALAEKINITLDRFPPGETVFLVFSAHGVPRDVIDAGDPYREQVAATVELVLEHGRWSHPHLLCYQSKVGPGRWLQPSLSVTIRELAAQGARNLLVIPIAFVTDHIETLHEIDQEARAEATALGIARFEVMPALNDSPKFIQALADLVLKCVGAEVLR